MEIFPTGVIRGVWKAAAFVPVLLPGMKGADTSFYLLRLGCLVEVVRAGERS